MTDPEFENSEIFPVKPPTSYVIFQRWPEDGDGWIHPEDRGKTEGHIPSELVWRRDATDDPSYPYVITYGEVKIRTKAVMAEEIADPEFEVGDLVELQQQFESEHTEVARIYEVRYSHFHQQAQYLLIRGDLKSRTPYLAKDLKPFEPPKDFHAPYRYEPES